jgi:hypothetical protein
MKKAVVFSFCRMNPPTKGHEILVKGMLSLAKLGNADTILFLSQSVDKDNPLRYETKRRIVRAAFPKIKVSGDKLASNPYLALMQLHLSGKYDQIVFMVGSDRYEKFSNGRFAEWAKDIGIKQFAIVSAGQRDNSNTAKGASATKLRELARSGSETKFCAGLPNQLNSTMKKQVYQLTVKGLVKPVQRRKANART